MGMTMNIKTTATPKLWPQTINWSSHLQNGTTLTTMESSQAEPTGPEEYPISVLLAARSVS